ncbi:MAG: response regulator, partial [Candidatus Latescibacteria bacterium]|nr:response regulator [Candidatus Latescibacterota bacterium]
NRKRIDFSLSHRLIFEPGSQLFREKATLMPEETILIVDDDPSIRGMLSEFLTGLNYHVLLAESGEQALGRLETGPVHMALVDLKLPGMDGIKTVRAIKERDADVLIIMMTGYPSTESAVRALRYQVYDYLIKPFELAGLEPMIRHALEQQQLQTVDSDLRKKISEMNRRLQMRIEELSFIRKISADIESKTELDEILRTVLTGLTAGEALGFNRAFLFLMNEDRNVLEGVMAVGPADAEEAHRVWSELAERRLSLRDIMHTRKAGKGDRILTDLIRKRKIPMDGESALTCTVKNRTVLNITERKVREFGETFPIEMEADRFVAVPLLVKEGPVGVLVADNLFSRREITEQDVQILVTFANQASVAIENARLSIGLEEKVRELAHAHQELQENHARLMSAERLAAVGEMAAQIIHEIKTPLISIGGFARLIRKTLPTDDPNIISYLTIISEEVSRLERVIENLLILAKPGHPNARPDDLNEVVEKALLLVGEHTEEAHIEVHTSLDADMLPLEFDRNQLRQVLLNLLQNAIHAMPDGGSLRVTTRQKKAFIQIVVQDSGVGIPDEHMNKLFIPFFTTKLNGAGLGLSITHKILENHSGFIEVTSESGVGTTFVVNLPLKQPPKENA